MRKLKKTLAPALVLAMALAVGACEVVDDDPGGTLPGGTLPGGTTIVPPGDTTTTTLDS